MKETRLTTTCKRAGFLSTGRRNITSSGGKGARSVKLLLKEFIR